MTPRTTVTARRSLVLWGTLGSLLAAVEVAADEPARAVIEIGNPNFRPYPLAVPEVRDTGGAATSAREALEALRFDFELSPLFRLLDPKSYLANPQKEGMNAVEINFSDWLSIGAEGLIKVSLTVAGGTLRGDFRLYDVATGKEQLRKAYQGRPDEARDLGHRFANDVVELFTGSKGVFRTKIAAVKKSKTGREVVVLDLDGSKVRAVTENGSINLLPAWARDGRGILFTSYLRHNPNLFLLELTSDAKPKLLSGERGLNTGGVMSPDGKRVALTLSRDGNSEIYVMNADGTGLTRLTEEWAIDSSPSWSPDGRSIAFVSARRGDPHIFVMDADGKNVRRITMRGNYNQTPDWNPRRNVIAFTARDERNVFDIFTVDVDSGEIKRLTQDQGNNEEPSWSPDGNLLAFTSTRENRSQVWVMAFDGTRQRRITDQGEFSTPAWSPAVD